MQLSDIQPQVFFAVQVAADVILLAAVLWLLSRMGREWKVRSVQVDPKAMGEFKALVEESQRSAAELAKTLEEGKKALRELSIDLERKEAELRALLEQASGRIQTETGATAPAGPRETRYDEAIRLARDGRQPEEIAERLGIPEGEVRLLLELSRGRPDNR